MGDDRSINMGGAYRGIKILSLKSDFRLASDTGGSTRVIDKESLEFGHVKMVLKKLARAM
jgi:hypothetical protein